MPGLSVIDSNVAFNCYHYLRPVPSSLPLRPARILSRSVLLACLARIREQQRCDHPCSARLPALPSFGTCRGSPRRTTHCRLDCTSAWLQRDFPRSCGIHSGRGQARCNLLFIPPATPKLVHLLVPDGSLTVIIDSADVLCADLESPSKAYALIATLLSGVIARPSESHGHLHSFSPICLIFPSSISEPSRLILHFATHSPLHDLVLTPRLSPTLAQVIAHPPALLKHLATAQLLPPPPASAPDRFWPVFAPLSARTWEVERIVLGPGCVGLSDDGETVLQVVTRGRGKNVERELEGWMLNDACSLSELDSLKGILEDKGKPKWAEVSKAAPAGSSRNDVIE